MILEVIGLALSIVAIALSWYNLGFHYGRKFEEKESLKLKALKQRKVEKICRLQDVVYEMQRRRDVSFIENYRKKQEDGRNNENTLQS
jgi:hypothetical protein